MTKSVGLWAGIILSCVIGLGGSGVALAQTSATGAITGTVADPSGAVVPNAKIRVTNQQTGLFRDVTTSSAGIYEAPLLPPGLYRVQVTAAGFKDMVVTDLVVNTSETAVADVKLQIGSQTAEVVVSGATELLQTQTAALGRTTSSQVILGLPLSNRNFTQLLALSPGVVSPLSAAGQMGKNNQDVSANGARPSMNNFEFNGLDANNISENDAQGFGPEVGLAIPAPDTIQEYKVQTGQYDAAYGRDAGANVDIVTKSGTNDFHGGAWEFFRNTDLDANDFFLNSSGQPRAVLNQNQFGFTLGGPIKRDKTFFFVSYQGTLQANGQSSLSLESSLMPPLTSDRSAATLGAEFGGETGAFGGTAVAPDGSNINPVALALLNFKLPNGQYAIPTPTTILPGDVGLYTASIPAHFREDQFTVNIDQALTSRNELSGRFFYSRDPTTSAYAQYQANVPGWGETIESKNVMLALADTQTISSRLINVARFGFMRFYGDATVDQPISNADVGITSPATNPGIPSISIVGLFTIGSYQPLFREATNNFEGEDMVSFISGRNSMEMGGEAKRAQLNTNLPYPPELTFLSFPDFLLGQSAAQNGSSDSNIYDSYVITGNPYKAERYIDFSGFFQDSFRATRRLTLNAGLRYDFFGPPSDTEGALANFDPTFANPNPPAMGDLSGIVLPSNYQGPLPPGVFKEPYSDLYAPDFRNFAPRFGFAYQLMHSLVLRGGYGIYYQMLSGQVALQTIGNQPFVLDTNYAGAGDAAATFQDPFNPLPPPTSSFPVFTPRTPASSQSPAAISTVMPTPYTQDYSLGLEEAISPNLVWAVEYVGNVSRHMTGCPNFNYAPLATPTNPIRGLTTSTVANVAERVPYLGLSTSSDECATEYNGNYNALDTSLTKRFSHGLTFLASYTWSHNLSVANGEANGTGGYLDLGGIYNDQNPRSSYGPAPFSIPQRFVTSFIYQPPKLKQGPDFARYAFSDWQFSGILVLQSGLPITVLDPSAGTIYGAPYDVLAECTGANPASSGSVESRLDQWFNTAAFTSAPVIGDGTGYGDCSESPLRGPDERNLDFGIERIFPVMNEKRSISFRTEFFNFTNTPKFGLPDSEYGTQGFGTITSSASNPRIIQFALKFQF